MSQLKIQFNNQRVRSVRIVKIWHGQGVLGTKEEMWRPDDETRSKVGIDVDELVVSTTIDPNYVNIVYKRKNKVLSQTLIPHQMIEEIEVQNVTTTDE